MNLLSNHIANRLLSFPFDAPSHQQPNYPRWRVESANDTTSGSTLSVELPGVKDEEIHLSTEQRKLSLKVTTDEESAGFVPAFEKTWQLSAATNLDRISASYADGVLTVSLPSVSQENFVKQIPLNQNQTPAIEAQ